MTMASVGMVLWPEQLQPSSIRSDNMSQASITFDSTTDRLAWVGHMWHTDSIAKVYFRTGTVTTGDTVEVRIETVTNGRPSGTLIDSATTNNAKATVAIADGDDNVWKTATLGAAASITPGTLVAIVIVWSAESAGAGIAINFSSSPASASGMSGQFPLLLQDTGGGTWGASSGAQLAYNWVVELSTAGVIALPGLTPVDGGGTITSFNSGTNPNERAAKFVPPFKCRVIGMRVAMFNIAAGGDFTFSIWDSTDNPGAAPTPLAQTSSLDGDMAYTTSVDGPVTMMFAAPVTLTAGTTYYAGVRPDTANNIGLGELSAAGTGAATNAIRALPAGANAFHLATRQWSGTDPGAWTDTTTTFPMISLLIDQLDDGASAGGGGGMRLAGPGGLAA